MQTTIRTPVRLAGIGLHSGRAVRLTLRPAPADHGIVFIRTDARPGPARIPALWDAAVEAELHTRLVNGDGVEVMTTEHLMAAAAGTGVTNLVVEIDGPEVPLLDGSAAPFVRAILGAGVVRQDAPVGAIEILREVVVRNGPSSASLAPHRGFAMSFEIDFADSVIGHQSKTLDLANGAFVHELCDARTFCRAGDIDAMRARGLIVGGSLSSAVVVDGDEVVTPGGLRHADEPVRHKMLDALGDLALAGAPILGRYRGVRAGHTLTNRLLRAVFADPANWRRVTLDAATAARLPGAGVTAEDLPRAA